MPGQEERISDIEVPEPDSKKGSETDTLNIVIHYETGRDDPVGRGLDLTVSKGRSLALIGDPDLGRVTFKLPVTNLEKIGITLVFQNPMSILNPAQTLMEQIVYIIRIHQHASLKVAEERAEEILKKVGISRLRAEDYPHNLSDEMKQRFVIAAALAHAPVLLIANETACPLDMPVKVQLLNLLKDIITDTGMALLLITLNDSLAREICDDVAVL